MIQRYVNVIPRTIKAGCFREVTAVIERYVNVIPRTMKAGCFRDMTAVIERYVNVIPRTMKAGCFRDMTAVIERYVNVIPRTKEAGCFREVTAVTLITNTVGNGMAHQSLPAVWRSAPVWEVVDKHCFIKKWCLETRLKGNPTGPWMEYSRSCCCQEE